MIERREERSKEAQRVEVRLRHTPRLVAFFLRRAHAVPRSIRRLELIGKSQ